MFRKFMLRKFLYLFVTIAHIGAVAAILPQSAIASDNRQSMIWQANGANNTIYILGSVHVLTKDDYPLPRIYQHAFDEAETIILETDLSGDNAQIIAGMMDKASQFDNDQDLKTTIEQYLGKSGYRDLGQLAAQYGISLTLLNDREPWFVSLVMTNMAVVQNGFSPLHGIDMHFMQQAENQQKPISGLEDIAFQATLFDTLPMEVQVEFLQDSLEDLPDSKAILDDIINAWRMGDLTALSHKINDELAKTPLLADQLLFKRNQDWANKINAMFQDKDDYLIIVGAGHLTGPHNLFDLLEHNGHHFTRLPLTAQ